MHFIGIDLGTTNSLVALFREGKAELIPNALGCFLTPSVVSVEEKSGEIYVGNIAKQRLVSHPNLSASVFKRNMGSTKNYKLGKHQFKPEELSALVLKSLKEDAENFLGKTIETAVISVPAYFNDTQRAATMTAAKIAGFKVDRLLNEPTAAAILHGVQLDSEQQFLVLDLGGGTFDVTVLEVFDGILEVHASAGDNHLGGEDFTQILARDIARKYQLKNSTAPILLDIAEIIKTRLSERPEITFETTLESRQVLIQYTREEFDILVLPLLTRLSTPIAKALGDASISPQDLDDIIFVGGATRMPAFSRFISKMFKRFPRTEHNPDHVVALGAATQAALSGRDAALVDVVLTDVMPYSLGTSISADGRSAAEVFSPVIERNTTIPVSRVERYTALSPRQTMLEFSIYQGESRNVKNNILLGAFSIKLPPNSIVCEEADLRFSYDNNGLLEVEATLLSTGEKTTLVIQNNSERMSEDDIAVSLKKLESIKTHPADKQENQLIIARGERLFEMFSGESRDRAHQLLSYFEAALQTQDEKRIREVREEISPLLDELESMGYE